MPSQEEKQRRKALQNQLNAEAKAGKLASLPMPKEKLVAYFDYLDLELTEHGCDDTLRLTKQFAEAEGLAFEPIKLWLSEYGGYCDCEALANVEEEFENI
ncbi:DUF2695 domain-containing protein [Hymenobacter sp. BT770]|uniref:DUF2695 domain-containing protein n=1 Tax=Hymenobacter sp. BT770 TaxID=2886942 RepID=UPI001D0FEA36|nr:DUF2695 domain-containing protein [Hymenobacter sp. BT770]MCC3152860.1 DUF2695 domain-containing protein [Hymenobacter sp. BT770]MDO3414935.1 DUF2695 domain-containing protein [Hymenobacter sp. BT770]